MMKILTKKEIKEQLKELLKFCKENHITMWNFMIMVENIRKKERELLFEKLRNKLKTRFNMKEKYIQELLNQIN